MNWTILISQCVMCYRTAAAQQLERSRVLNGGILILLAPPMVVLGGILGLAWRRQRSRPASSISANSPGFGSPATKKLDCASETDLSPGNRDMVATIEISVQLPDDIARHLGASHPDLSRAAQEAIALEGARSGELTTAQVRRLMGFTTGTQADAFLKAHAVYLPVTLADVERDAETSRRFRLQ